jgi:hypothetical protein
MRRIGIQTTATITKQRDSYRVRGITDAEITSTRLEGDTLVMEGISDPVMGRARTGSASRSR